jgi:hypothetical protein
MDGAIQQWAFENNASSNAVATWEEIAPYFGRGADFPAIPQCPQGGRYTFGPVTEPPRCSIMEHNLDFGRVFLVDESNLPLIDARVTVWSNRVELGYVVTSTDGEAFLFDYRDSWRDRIPGEAWSGGAIRLVATREGYETVTVSLPTYDWPLRFVLKRSMP